MPRTRSSTVARLGEVARAVILGVALSAQAPPVAAETDRLVSDDGVAADNFGSSISMSGATLAVGAPFTEEGVLQSVGSVYIFDFSDAGGWSQTIKILAPDFAEFDVFGTSVALSGDDLVVGATGAAIGANSSQGAAYVFGRNVGGPNQWGFVRKLVGPASIGNLADYGLSVAISGDRIVVGSPNADTPSPGRAFVYSRHEGGTDMWGQVANLVDDISDDNAQFGREVAVDGNLVVVGAENLDFVPGSFNNEGAVYVFDAANGFAQVGKLFASNHSDNDRMSTVAIHGTTIVAAARFAEGGGSGRGQAYVFKNPTRAANGWTEVRTLLASNGLNSAFYGTSVAIEDTIVVIGASSHNAGTGEAYRYHENLGGPDQYGENTILTRSDPATSDFFGRDVTISDGVVASSSYLKGPGVVYVYGTPRTTAGAPPAPAPTVAWRAWPNPARDVVRFGSGSRVLGDVDVFDVRGRHVGTARADARGESAWHVPPSLGSGLYFARPRTVGGRARRIVVQR